MHRSYRMRYGEEPIVDGYIPIRIIVRKMSGREYILFTENDNETFLDVKRALLPHVDSAPMPTLETLIFQSGNTEIGYENVDDSATVLSKAPDRIITLELILPIWSAKQQRIIDAASEENVSISVWDIEDFNHAEMEAFQWGLQNNLSILSLKIENVGNEDEDDELSHNYALAMATFMHVLRNSTSIQYLSFIGDGFRKNVMATFFDAIGQNNSLVSLDIRCPCTYRLADLTQLLARNTSLGYIRLSKCYIKIKNDRHIRRFGEVLAHQPLRYLTLINNTIDNKDDEAVRKASKLRDIFHRRGARDNGSSEGNSHRIGVDWGEKPDDEQMLDDREVLAVNNFFVRMFNPFL